MRLVRAREQRFTTENLTGTERRLPQSPLDCYGDAFGNDNALAPSRRTLTGVLAGRMILAPPQQSLE